MTPTFVYSIPAILALVAKMGMLYFARTAKVQNTQTRLFLAALVASIILSVAEVALLNRLVANPPWPEIVFYFAASIPCLALLLHVSVSISFDNWSAPRLYPLYFVIYAYGALLEFLLLFTPWLLAGVEPFSTYSFTRVPGPLYWLYELFLVAGFLGVMAIPLAFGLRSSRSQMARNKCKVWILAISPMTILVISIVILLHFKIRWINSTVTLPIALAFFYGVVGYAIHNYRLFDIEFYIPWSKVRKRKTAFYDRIRATIAEIADLTSVNQVVNRLADTLHCPVALIGGQKPVLALAGESFGMARFPTKELQKIDHIVVANEITEAMPETHVLMMRHKIAAIVPFHPHSEAAASWMLLGERFSEEVYTPLDFRMVEQLFDRMADVFLDKLLLMRTQLADAQKEMHSLHRRLANAWEELESTRKENQKLRVQNAQLLRQHATSVGLTVLNPASVTPAPAPSVEPLIAIQDKTLDDYVAEFEARIIEQVLKRCDGNKAQAARLLGLRPNTLHYKIERYGLTDKTDKK